MLIIASLGGATSSTYDDTGAPAPTITPGTADATDGTSPEYVTLSVSGESASNGTGRYYRVVLNATGASENTSVSNRGYRGTTTLGYQWYRSAVDSDENFSSIGGATTDPYNDTNGAVEPSGKWYYAEINMSGATSQNTTHNRGYKSASPPTPVADGNLIGIGIILR